MPSFAVSLDKVPMVLSAAAALTVRRASCIAVVVFISTPHQRVGGTSIPREMMLLAPVVADRIHMKPGSIQGRLAPLLLPWPNMICAASALMTRWVDSGGVA